MTHLRHRPWTAGRLRHTEKRKDGGRSPHSLRSPAWSERAQRRPSGAAAGSQTRRNLRSREALWLDYFRVRSWFQSFARHYTPLIPRLLRGLRVANAFENRLLLRVAAQSPPTPSLHISTRHQNRISWAIPAPVTPLPKKSSPSTNPQP